MDQVNDNEDNDVQWTLETLPIEVLLHISQFLDTQTLLQTLSLVNKYFYGIFSNEKTWEIRQNKMSNNHRFPPIKHDNLPPLFFRHTSLRREQTLSLWSNFHKLELTPHLVCIDAVHLLRQNQLLISGSRDRSIALTNLDKLINENEDVSITRQNAHNGWVWDFCGVNSNQVASGGWDRSIKFWDVEEMKVVGDVVTPAACLCLSSCPESGVIVAGNFDKSILIIDARAKQLVNTYKKHRHCVLSIGVSQDEIVSAGEDGRVVCYDIRTNKVRGSLQIPSNNSQVKNYPKSLSFAKTGNYPLKQFYIGDIRGSLHLVDQLKFQIVKTYDICDGAKIMGVFHTLGGVMTCTSTGQLSVFEPTLEMKRIGGVSLGDKVELPKVHSLNNRVALAGGDGIVRVFY